MTGSHIYCQAPGHGPAWQKCLTFLCAGRITSYRVQRQEKHTYKRLYVRLYVEKKKKKEMEKERNTYRERDMGEIEQKKKEERKEVNLKTRQGRPSLKQSLHRLAPPLHVICDV